MAPTSQYPHKDGDITVLGPEIFASSDGEVICWKGENYTRQAAPPATEATQPPRSPLRDQVAAALLARIKQATVKPALPSGAPYASLFAANEFDLADAALSVVLPHGKTVGGLLRDSDEQLLQALQAIQRVRAETARMRAITRTWDPAADLIDAALDGTKPSAGQRERPTHPDGTPYRYDEIVASNWGHCDACSMWGQWTTANPHQCSQTPAQGGA